jgi:hypothetical protein
MTKDEITIPPFHSVDDFPEDNEIMVSWKENEQRWFRIVKYDDLPNLTPIKIMTRKNYKK